MNRKKLTHSGLSPCVCLRSARIVFPDTASGVLQKRHSPMRQHDLGNEAPRSSVTGGEF